MASRNPAASASAAAGDFDDQAWDIQSDDDDFVSRVAPRTNVPRSLKSTSRSSSYLSTTSSSRQSSSPSHAVGPSRAIPVPQRPTDHPHPERISHRSDSSGSHPTRSQSHTSELPTAQSEEPSSLRSNSSQRWTIVDAVKGASPANAATAASIAGSPPADVGSIELRRETSAAGSGSGFQIVANDDAESTIVPPGPAHRRAPFSGVNDEPNCDSEEEAEEVDLDTGKTVMRKRSGQRKGLSGKSEAEALKKAVRPDLDQLIKDPTHALARLSLCWDGPSTSGTPASEEQRPKEQATSTVPSSSSTGFTFDPVAAAGDGLIMAGPSFADDAQAEPNGDPRSISGSIVPVTTPGGLGYPTPSRKRSIRSSRRRQQLLNCLSKPSVDISVLRSLAWAGVPDELRPVVWQLLLGYLPTVAAVRTQTLSRKRAEYAAGVRLAFAKGTAGLDQAIWHQIHIDVPRTNPGIRLWQRDATQRALERILYVWAIRHPASGYVQGINDLATPLFEVFLSAYIDSDPELYDVSLLPAEALEALEADTFWCLSKLLDGIQDNYIFAQPGIQRQVRRMGELVARIDAPLHAHLQAQGVEYMQFAFRWMNCLLMREMSVRNIIRMWDTYLAEGQDAFSDFHLYVCSVFLHKWSKELMEMDFQGIIMYLQSLPTRGWSDKDAEMLLSEAFMYKTLFGNTAHLNK